MQRCQHWVSEPKSGTERVKKRKKRELVISPPPGTQLVHIYIVHRLDATWMLPSGARITRVSRIEFVLESSVYPGYWPIIGLGTCKC